MTDFTIDLQRTYPELCPCTVKDSEGEVHSFDIPVVFKVKTNKALTQDLEALAKKEPEKMANTSLPALWVVVESVDLDATPVRNNGKKLAKKLHKEAAILDPMLSAAIYKHYQRTITGNFPAAT